MEPKHNIQNENLVSDSKNLKQEDAGLSTESPKTDHPSAVLRDGERLSVGDEVHTNWHPQCKDTIFVVFQITPYEYCESGSLVNVHVKGEPDRILKTTDGRGLDGNWFQKVKSE